jgi:hypothetical protein
MNSRQAEQVIVSTSQPEEADGRSASFRARREDRSSGWTVPNTRTPEDAEREAKVADAVDDEGLDRGGIGEGFLYQKPISR